MSGGSYWQQLSDWFDRALDADEPARSALLAEAAAQDPALAQELARLLAAQARAHPLLDLPQRASPPAAGDHIDGFVLQRLLGRGGMGEVWLAERRDGEFRHRVALKYPNVGHGQHHARFLRESATLARLQHPGIARFLGHGIDAAGRPYLLLEYVDGVRIDDHCNQRRADPRERVRFLRAILDALEHAHRHLVVHRDLKPANVLVDREGRVRLLDFGIAKWLDAGAAELTEARAPLTPRYAAPEQLRGEPVTTATDVWGAGVLLYELLTGRSPFASNEPAALYAAITERDADTLRQGWRGAGDAAARYAIEAPGIERALGGDLQLIVARALARDPAARYRSAAEFGADLGAWLEFRPLLSRPPAWTRRLISLMRRHRLASALAALALASSVLGALATWSQAQRAAKQAQRAEVARALLARVFSAGDPEVNQGREPSVREVLDRGVAELAAANIDVTTRALLHHDLGRVYLSLDRRSEALRLLDAAQADVAAGAEMDAAQRLRLDLDRAQALLALDRAADAWALLDARRDDLPREPLLDADGLRLIDLGAEVLLRLDRLDDAAAWLQPYRDWPEDERVAPATALQLGLTEAALLQRRGEPRAALALLDRLGARLPADAPASLRQSWLGASVQAARDSGELERALAAQRQHHALVEATFGPQHSRSLHSALMLANLLRLTSQFAAADALYRDVIDRQARAGSEPAQRAEALLGYALMQLQLGWHVQAAQLFERAAGLYASTLGPRHSVTLQAHEGRALALAQTLQAQPAAAIMAEVVARHRETGDQQKLVSALATQAMAQSALGQSTPALAAIDESLSLAQRLGQPDEWQRVLRGRFLRELGQLDRARSELEAVVDEYRTRIAPKGGPRRATAERELALTLQVLGEHAAARELLASVLEQRERLLGAASPLAEQSRRELAALSPGS